MFVNAALLIATDCSYKGLKDGVDDKKLHLSGAILKKEKNQIFLALAPHLACPHLGNWDLEDFLLFDVRNSPWTG